MARLESEFQYSLMEEIRDLYPDCVILKNDANYIQGFPDWTILYRDKWAVLEAKRDRESRKQPNQEYYVGMLNNMSYSSFVYPENKEEVLRELQQLFNA